MTSWAVMVSKAEAIASIRLGRERASALRRNSLSLLHIFSSKNSLRVYWWLGFRGRRCGRLWCKTLVDEYDTVRVSVPGGHPDLPIIALTNINACPIALDWERFAVLALPSLPKFSGCPQFVASRTYQVSGILVDLGDAVFRVPPLVQVCIVFVNGLPTNDRPLYCNKNRVTRE